MEKRKTCDIPYYNHRKSATERRSVCNGRQYNRKMDNNHFHHGSEYNTLWGKERREIIVNRHSFHRKENVNESKIIVYNHTYHPRTGLGS